MSFEDHQFKPLELRDTNINVWQERDRLHIWLSRKDTGKALVEWWDEEAQEAIADGFLCIREAKLGNLERFVQQGGSLHKSAFEYWRTRISKPQKQKSS